MSLRRHLLTLCAVALATCALAGPAAAATTTPQPPTHAPHVFDDPFFFDATG
jgi:hypothetical protein